MRSILTSAVRKREQRRVVFLHGTSAVEVNGQSCLGDIRHCYADLTRVRGALGYQAEVTLEVGLRGFAEWVLRQPLPQDQLVRANQELSDRGLM